MRRSIHEDVIITGWEIVSKRVRKPTSRVAVRQQIFQHDAGIGQKCGGYPLICVGLYGLQQDVAKTPHGMVPLCTLPVPSVSLVRRLTCPKGSLDFDSPHSEKSSPLAPVPRGEGLGVRGKRVPVGERGICPDERAHAITSHNDARGPLTPSPSPQITVARGD
jgi:hypothetical protein